MMTDLLLQRAKALKLIGLIAHWEEVHDDDWVKKLLAWEEEERTTQPHRPPQIVTHRPL